MSGQRNFDVLVVGGGAAGLMAAGTLLQRGRTVALFDKNQQLGRKLRITGKGRCNVTNDCTVEEAVAACPPGREVPLRGLFPLYPPGHHGLF